MEHTLSKKCAIEEKKVTNGYGERNNRKKVDSAL